jgi:hypothetical protein
MALLEPPVTDDSALNFTLSRLTEQVNRQEVQIRAILTAIQNATDFADLKEKVKGT